MWPPQYKLFQGRGFLLYPQNPLLPGTEEALSNHAVTDGLSELKIYSISHISDCVSPHVSRWWLDQEVWWSINKHRAHSNTSKKFFFQKKVFTKCFGDMRSHNWIRGVQSRARHDNSNGNRGNILLTGCLKNSGQAKHVSSHTVWGWYLWFSASQEDINS